MKKTVEAQAKKLIQMENTCKELRSRVVTEKYNRLGKKYDEGKGKGENIEGLKKMGMGNLKDDEGETSEEAFQEDLHEGRETWRDRR